MQRFEIDNFPWGRPPVYPESSAEIEFLKDGISVFMYSKEKKPRCTVVLPNGPVYQDSCLEFFFCPRPEQSCAYYNFEVNPLGTLYAGYSPDGTRESSAPIDPAEAAASVAVTADLDPKQELWSVRFTVPYDFIRRRTPEFGNGGQDHITGNFYKCAELSAYPHYAVWNPIDSNIITKPDFHVVKYFGKIEIK
ncbi:MAG: carbohydrate-binding family 9-like protein [Clostridia bacterium]